MQFLTSLLGGSGNTIITSVLALGFVLALIVLGLWVLKLTMRTGTMVGRGRNRRLSIVDQMQIDPKRQLLIIRRDDVEHLILTGGTQDLVVETGIAVDRSAAGTRRAPVAQTAEDGTQPPEEPRRPTVISPRLGRLKDMALPSTLRKPTSLRHTGLLRPVSTMEPAIMAMPPLAGDNSGRGAADSATSANGIGNGQTELGAARSFRNGRKADSP